MVKISFKTNFIWLFLIVLKRVLLSFAIIHLFCHCFNACSTIFSLFVLSLSLHFFNFCSSLRFLDLIRARLSSSSTSHQQIFVHCAWDSPRAIWIHHWWLVRWCAFISAQSVYMIFKKVERKQKRLKKRNYYKWKIHKSNEAHTTRS